MTVAHQTVEDRATKSPWDAPSATALTETESRADQADTWMQNGIVGVS